MVLKVARRLCSCLCGLTVSYVFVLSGNKYSFEYRILLYFSRHEVNMHGRHLLSSSIVVEPMGLAIHCATISTSKHLMWFPSERPRVITWTCG
ncbi:hypothetical protein PENSPDRAFT_486290 [Peniophora sp. CONT]|nr:hypothetical protein PENSPDRAFT_486290 [Peniophora sp. CONT]